MLQVLHALDACIEKQLDVITGDVVERGSADLQACLNIPQAKQKATKVFQIFEITDFFQKSLGVVLGVRCCAFFLNIAIFLQEKEWRC